MIPPLRRWLPLIAVLLIGVPVRGEIEDLPEALLDGNSLPDPDWSAILDGWIKEGRPIPDLPPDETGPPETARPAELLAYWRDHWPWQKGQEPGAAMREKILEAVKAQPSAAADALRALPQSADAAKAVLELIPKLPAATAENLKDLRKVRAWVFRHGGMLREEVVADARLADWENYQWWQDSDETLDALKAGEPALARKVFGELAKGDNPGLAVVAAGLLLESSEAEEAGKWREQLIAAAANAGYPEEARGIAVAALTKHSWPEKEAWFLGALKQEEIGDVAWYSRLVTDSPDRWIAPLVGLLGGENRQAHNHAACLLVLPSDRPEAIRPLLPWLKDPEWAKGRNFARLDLIQALEEVKLPECVPALRHLILHDPHEQCVKYACGVLLHYQAKEAASDIKTAIERKDLKMSRHEMAKAVHELGGFSAEEMAADIAAFFTDTPDDRDAFDLSHKDLDGMTPSASVGSYLVEVLPQNQVPVELLVARAEGLQQEHPEAATELLNFIAMSPLPAGQKTLAQLLREGKLSDKSLARVLEWRRDNRAKWDGSAFTDLTGQEGVVGGIAAVLSGERKAMDQALASGDFHKQHAVIAAAWLSRDALDVGQLAKLHALGQDDDDEDEKEPTEEQEELARGAWTYLMDSEDPQAMSFVKKQRGDGLEAPYGLWGGAGRSETRDERASEVFEMAQTEGGGGHGSRSLIVFPDRVVATQTSHGRSGSCMIPPEKVAALRNYVTTYHADELPTLEWGMADGYSYHYSHVTAEGIRSVHMSNPPESRDAVLAMLEEDEGRFSKGVVLYGQLMWQFNQVFEGLEMDYGYGPGIEILSPREEAEARSVWMGDGEIRVLVNPPGEWRIYSPPHGRLLDAAKRPPGFMVPPSSDEEYPGLDFADLEKPWLHRSGEALIQSGRHEGKKGLWRHARGEQPELIAEGEFLHELVSPDGQWCVASKSAKGEGWAEPNTMVRIKLATKEVFPIDLPAAEEFEAITFLDAHGKFLIRRSRDAFPGDVKVGPEKSEYHLLDPASGGLEKVSGDLDFRPLGDEDLRPLQATGEPFKVWAVDPSPGGQQTVVGKYDTKSFQFVAVREIEGIRFEGSAMWVDEAAGMIYAAVNGDLVGVPLRAK